jgi:hypothetical protein
MHKKERNLDPTLFEAKRVDLASEVVTAVVENPPSWGRFTFKFKQEGQPLTLIHI